MVVFLTKFFFTFIVAYIIPRMFMRCLDALTEKAAKSTVIWTKDQKNGVSRLLTLLFFKLWLVNKEQSCSFHTSRKQVVASIPLYPAPFLCQSGAARRCVLDVRTMMCCTSLQESEGLKTEESERVWDARGEWMPSGWFSSGGGSLGLQSQSDDTGSHGGREGGAWQWAGAAAIGVRGHLSGCS